ncbi:MULTISPECIES: low molecular weight protein-tyrosine-phosphatase [unclassified Sphingomonas]|uniref:low molecular weight protein-tyrosine-phosphatase n=1 Tax=unclassified Sphingomonas TaxID=196159 RepID=UPI0022B3B390|nr:low molecular weight protein-tyrosine-phosphatase [Sphingomonas sp. NIBR02145]WHU01017.1 low molecular weight protein-tyrosine-phosphatase [Sphingomonas sp. NIBR02145]
MTSVLFVCLGNICRSPLAEGALRAAAARAGLEVTVDSAGTGGWHAGEPPDRRAQAAATRHGTDISGQRARQVRPEDFRRFDHVFALDRQNLRDLQAILPADATAELGLLMDLVRGREGSSVADPYYGEDSDFDVTWDDVSAAADVLVTRLGGR